MKNYTIKFKFNTIIKNNIQGMNGEVDITYDGPKDDLKDSPELIQLIANDMAQKTKKGILSVNITEVVEMETINN